MVMTIPTTLLKLIKVGEGDDVALAVNKGSLVVRPAAWPRKRYTIAELLEGSESLIELNEEIASGLQGDPIGRERG